MLIEALDDDFAALQEGHAPRGLTLPDSAVAEPAVIGLLRNLASDVRTRFAPSAWLIVEEGELVGLCSALAAPESGNLRIGYGVAPTREGRGVTTRAVAELLAWARLDARVDIISAETSVQNLASQKVLKRNGFQVASERADEEDGAVMNWQVKTV